MASIPRQTFQDVNQVFGAFPVNVNLYYVTAFQNLESHHVILHLNSWIVRRTCT